MRIIGFIVLCFVVSGLFAADILCPKCGKKTPEGADYCVECASDLNQKGQTENNEVQKSAAVSEIKREKPEPGETGRYQLYQARISVPRKDCNPDMLSKNKRPSAPSGEFGMLFRIDTSTGKVWRYKLNEIKEGQNCFQEEGWQEVPEEIVKKQVNQ